MSPVALAAAAALAAVAVPPAPTHWVEDRAGAMTAAARDALDARLDAYEMATGHQVVVWTDKTLAGAAVGDWAVRTFAAWKIGRAGLDDGVVLFVLTDDHAIDIEVGYGMEDRVPDAVASRIIREIMAPRLRAGDADGAITAGANAILTAIEGQPWTAASGSAQPTAAPISTGTWLVGGLILLIVLYLFVRHPRSLLALFWIFGRSFGGGSGGFGGRGGRSGGGGARGGW